MAANTRARNDSRKSQIKENYVQSVAGAELWGEIVSPSAAGPHSVSKVKSCLAAATLNPDMANQFAPMQAFNRAIAKMKEGRVIDKLKRHGDEVTFQFSRKVFETEEIKYNQEAFVKLDLNTGKVACKNKELEILAQKKLDDARDSFETSDITNMVIRMFDEHAELVAIGTYKKADGSERKKGGTYFVPALHMKFAEQIEKFLVCLGGGMSRWPIAKGMPGDLGKKYDKTVTESVLAHMKTAVNELDQAIDDFGDRTRQGTMDAVAERIKKGFTRVEGLSAMLGDYKDMLDAAFTKLNEKAVKRIKEVAEEKKRSEGEPKGKDGFGSRLGTDRAHINRVLSTTPMTWDQILVAANLKGNITYLPTKHMDAMIANGYVKEEPAGFVLTKKGVKAQKAPPVMSKDKPSANGDGESHDEE